MLLRPTRVREKPARFHISTHVPTKNAPDFIFPHPDTPKNAPHFTLPNRDRPKTCPVLHPNLRRRTFRGVCFCAPTRARAKFGRFHIFPSVPAKNAPDFPYPNRDAPKTGPVLGANSCRRIFGGVCNTPLHGYVHNSSSFIFPHPDTSKTHPISPFPIRIHPNPARF